MRFFVFLIKGLKSFFFCCNIVLGGKKCIKVVISVEKMFTGEYKHSLDPKNRVSIPSKFREEAGSSVFVTRGLDHCLFVFSVDEWSEFSKGLSELPISNKDARKFARTFLSGAVECHFDKQGRILLPQFLKKHAFIEKEVYVNGAGSRMEIWDAARWEEYSYSMTNDIDEIAEGMESLGIRF